MREEERARGLHEGLRLRVLDRGRHPHSKEGGPVQKEVLLGKLSSQIDCGGRKELCRLDLVTPI